MHSIAWIVCVVCAWCVCVYVWGVCGVCDHDCVWRCLRVKMPACFCGCACRILGQAAVHSSTAAAGGRWVLSAACALLPPLSCCTALEGLACAMRLWAIAGQSHQDAGSPRAAQRGMLECSWRAALPSATTTGGGGLLLGLTPSPAVLSMAPPIRCSFPRSSQCTFKTWTAQGAIQVRVCSVWAGSSIQRELRRCGFCVRLRRCLWAGCVCGGGGA